MMRKKCIDVQPINIIRIINEMKQLLYVLPEILEILEITSRLCLMNFIESRDFVLCITDVR